MVLLRGFGAASLRVAFDDNNGSRLWVMARRGACDRRLRQAPATEAPPPSPAARASKRPRWELNYPDDPTSGTILEAVVASNNAAVVPRSDSALHWLYRYQSVVKKKYRALEIRVFGKLKVAFFTPGFLSFSKTIGRKSPKCVLQEPMHICFLFLFLVLLLTRHKYREIWTHVANFLNGRWLERTEPNLILFIWSSRVNRLPNSF